jgi:L-aspartate oxidase
VLLDMRHVADLGTRFPTAVALCRRHGLDPFAEPVPITPAAHYHMGGIAVDDSGRTGVHGLFACGEVSCTGAHGANRLASNSLLEALVFGERVGRAVRSATPAAATTVERALARVRAERLTTPADDAVTAVRDLLMTHVGVLRTEEGLQSALQQLETLIAPDRGGTIAALARMVATAALHHRGTRGAHWRDDVTSVTGAHRVMVTAAGRSRPIASIVAPAWSRPRATVAC